MRDKKLRIFLEFEDADPQTYLLHPIGNEKIGTNPTLGDVAVVANSGRYLRYNDLSPGMSVTILISDSRVTGVIEELPEGAI